MHIDFASSPGPSLGIEVELELVDASTGALASAATEILTELGAGHPGGVHPKAKHELFECTVEIITGVCQTVSEARADLEKCRELSSATPVGQRCAAQLQTYQ